MSESWQCARLFQMGDRPTCTERIAALEARVEKLTLVLRDEIAMAEQSVGTLRDLHRNWLKMIDEKDDDGREPLITNMLFWLIEDVDPSGARAVLAKIDDDNEDIYVHGSVV